MQIAQSSKSAPDPVMEALKLMSNPSVLKERVKTLEDATKKHNKAKREHDDATKIAKTIEKADEYYESRMKAIDEAESVRSGKDKKRKAQLVSLEASISRREGAHEMLVKEHTQADNIKRADVATQAKSLATREATLERGKKQLAQDNYSLKQEKDALSERRARLAQAIKN